MDHDRDSLVRLFLTALERRRRLVSRLQAYRLFHGAHDGLDGVYVDQLGPLLLCHMRDGTVEMPLLEEVLWTLVNEVPGARAAAVRVHQTDPRKTSSSEMLPVCGQIDGAMKLSEGELAFICRPIEAVNAGVFIDMRGLRERLAAKFVGYRALNLFCYTGLLGLAAAYGGAREVVQVDLSRTVLDWARENEKLNADKHPATFRYIPEDARVYLGREVRRIRSGKEPYDLIIVDPPSFARSQKRYWNLRRELPEVAASALEALGADGVLCVTTNLTDITSRDVELMIRDIDTKRRIVEVEYLTPPEEDFGAFDPTQPVMRGVWIRCR